MPRSVVGGTDAPPRSAEWTIADRGAADVDVHAFIEYNACMKYRQNRRTSFGRVAERTVQFTVRRVPTEVEKALKRKATVSEKSLNTVLVEALSREAGVEREVVYHDLDSLAGTWEDDPAFDAALRAQHRIDKNLWK